MKTRIKSFNAVIATSIILLILIANDSAAGGHLEAKQSPGFGVGPESEVTTERNFLGSLNIIGRVTPGVYDLSFRSYRNGVMEPVTSLPARGGPLVLFAHVEDTEGNPVQDGTVTFEYCGNYEPKENCDVGLARWNRLNRMSIGSCYCRSCGGLPGFDPGPGNACLFVIDTGGFPAENGFRFKYAGKKGGVDSGMSGAANFIWTAAP